MMWRHTGLGLGGTPRRPNRPTTTWPSNSGGSSSPPDFATHALARPPRKKPKPSSQPGPQPEHDQPKLRNTRVDVVHPRQVTAGERLLLGLPGLGQFGDHRRGQPGRAAEELAQGG